MLSFVLCSKRCGPFIKDVGITCLVLHVDKNSQVLGAGTRVHFYRGSHENLGSPVLKEINYRNIAKSCIGLNPFKTLMRVTGTYDENKLVIAHPNLTSHFS